MVVARAGLTARRAKPVIAVDYPLHYDDATVRPWRTAAFVAVSVAAVELVLLVVVGGALLAKPDQAERRPAAKAAARSAAAVPAARKVVRAVKSAPAPVAELSRSKVSVLVLNGNGRTGAAAATASSVSRHGYRVGGVANASSSDFTRTLVMYRPGFEGEGRRLARDLGIPIVGPLDGMRPEQLHGAQTVIVVGA